VRLSLKDAASRLGFEQLYTSSPGATGFKRMRGKGQHASLKLIAIMSKECAYAPTRTLVPVTPPTTYSIIMDGIILRSRERVDAPAIGGIRVKEQLCLGWLREFRC